MSADSLVAPREHALRDTIINADTDRQDGRQEKNRSITFHVSLLYNLLLHHEASRPWWTRIQPHLMLGALPLKEKNHLDTLTQTEGVQAIVTMNQPRELLPNWLGTPITPDEWRVANVAQCFGSTSDFSPPTIDTIERCVTFIYDNVAGSRTTYVHCKAGRGRSTVIVIAYLMHHHNMTMDDAHAFVRSQRRHISLHPKQQAILQEYAATMIKKRQGFDPTGIT